MRSAKLSRSWSAVCAAVVCSVVGHAEHALAAPPAGYQLTFSDEFSGSAVDTSVWRTLDSRPNVSVVNGAAEFLTVQTAPNTFQEGWLDTIHFRQRYGYYETSMRIGNKSGLNNAFWLNTPGEWSGAENNHDRLEIDIIEGHFPNSASSDFNCSIHDWDTGSKNTIGGTGADVGNLSTAFNTVGLEWRTDNSIVFSINGVTRYTMTAAAMRESRNTIPLEVILSTKVLFDGFAGTVDPTVGGTKMSIDYVRVYDQAGFIGVMGNTGATAPTGTEVNWGTGSNWGDGDWDRTNQAALFNRASPFTTVTVAGADKRARDIVFDNNVVPALTFIPRNDFAAAVLRLGNYDAANAANNDVGAITINEDVVNSQTFNIPVVADGDLTLSNFSRTAGVKLLMNRPIRGTGPGRELTFMTTNDIEVTGNIESSIAVVQTYLAGTTRLAGTNDYTGQTLITRGTLNIASPTALGAAAAGTIVSSNATLGLSGGITYSRAEPVQIEGVGATGRTGAIERLDSSSVSIESMLITLAANATISNPNTAGSLRIGAINIPTGLSVTFTGAGTTQVNGPITGTGRLVSTGTGTVSLGTLAAVPGAVRFVNGSTLQIRSSVIQFQSSFSIDNAKVDLLDNAFILNDTVAGNDLTTIRGLVRTGFNNGAMNGNGILTSLSGTGRIIGFADNGVLGLTSFEGVPVTADNVLVKSTFPGDTNLSGTVNFADLSRMAPHYNVSSRTWTEGDFNYDLTVNFADLTQLARYYSDPNGLSGITAFSPFFQSEINRAFALIPEPTTVMSTLAFAAVALKRRRARQG
jgi:autotransporter-associated beta strand protein